MSGQGDRENSISVVIPARNAGNTLARAIDSVLAQSLAPDEIIVVDDASTDATAGVVGNYLDDRVKSITLRTQRGAAGARNAGIKAAKCSWIAFLDADDEWLPWKLAKQVELIRADPNVRLVFCASHEFAPSGRYLGDTYAGRPTKCGKEAWKALLACNFVATPTVVVRRELLLQLGGFDESLKVAEDQDMWVRLALITSLAYVPESLVRVHVRPESLSTWNLADQFKYTLPMIRRHLALLRNRLTGYEKRRIFGERLNRIGAVAAARGDLIHGTTMILRSALLGYRPLNSLMLACKLPAVAVIKWLLRHGGRRRINREKNDACAR